MIVKISPSAKILFVQSKRFSFDFDLYPLSCISDMAPNSLYEMATKAVVENFSKLRDGLDLCPEKVFFDVIYETYHQGKIRRDSSPTGKSKL